METRAIGLKKDGENDEKLKMNGETRPMTRERIYRHLILPLIAPAALVCLYFTPKAAFGCVNRGLMALGVVFLSLVGAIVTAMKSGAARRHGDIDTASWWTLSTLILIMPTVLLIGPLS